MKYQHGGAVCPFWWLGLCCSVLNSFLWKSRKVSWSRKLTAASAKSQAPLELETCFVNAPQYGPTQLNVLLK